MYLPRLYVPDSGRFGHFLGQKVTFWGEMLSSRLQFSLLCLAAHPAIPSFFFLLELLVANQRRTIYYYAQD
jgi:hypothetical protein